MTVFTLRHDRKVAKRNMFIYLGVVLFVALFGFIYELFSHGVYSFFMAFAFIFPLTLGLLIYLILFIINKDIYPSEFTSNMYNAGVATLTLGSLYKGVIDIYGTTRDLHLSIFFIVGISLLAIGVISYIISFFLRRK